MRGITRAINYSRLFHNPHRTCYLMSKILLTGSNGFIGRNVLSDLLTANHDVLCPIRNPASLNLRKASKRLSTLPGNFYDIRLFGKYADYSPDVILHFAAIRGAGQGSKSEYQSVNIQGTKNLIDFALRKKIKLIIYCSTVGVYGTIPTHLPAGPSTPANPDGHYHLTKFEAEKLIIQNLQGKIPFIILRPTITYGPGDNGFILKMIRMVKNKSFPLIHDDVRIHLLDVETLGELLTFILDREDYPQGVYNVADQASVHLSELVNLISNYYHHRNYSGNLIATPHFIFKWAGVLTNVLNMKSMNTSIQLISNSWYYDTSNLKEIFPLPLKESLEAIGNYLNQGAYDANQERKSQPVSSHT